MKVETIKLDGQYAGYVVDVMTDDDAMNPRKEFDNVGKMVCDHRRYDLGDTTLSEDSGHDIGDFKNRAHIERFYQIHKHAAVFKWLYLYDHSGLRIKIGSFHGLLPQGHAEFDSGCIGFIYCTREQVEKEWNGDLTKAEKYLAGEVDTYDDYLSGNVYGYNVKRLPDQETIDEEYDGDEDEALDAADEVGSSWGYYGYDHKKSGLLEAAESDVDCNLKYLASEAKKNTVMDAVWRQ